MENVLFKISFPAEFHAQTAVECALQLHPVVHDRLDEIEQVVIETQESGVRIIDKTGPLDNPADRDHCLQYMTAIPLIFGRLTAADYEDDVAQRSAHRCAAQQDASSRKPGLHRGLPRRGQALHRQFGPGVLQGRHANRAREVDVPIGHRKRRAEGIPMLLKKFEASVAALYSPQQTERIKLLVTDRSRIEAMPVHEFVSGLIKNH